METAVLFVTYRHLSPKMGALLIIYFHLLNISIMETHLNQWSNSKKKYYKIILLFIITLISLPALSLFLRGDYIEITDDCVCCGICQGLYPESFFVPDTGKASILVGYDINDVLDALDACPYEAILVEID